MSIERVAAAAGVVLLLCVTGRNTAHAQQTDKKARDSTLAVGLTAGESDGEPRLIQTVHGVGYVLRD